jgi:hypothetical protein
MLHRADKPRATRYEMSAPLMYRRLGEDTWCRGRTENISRNGVLFHVAVPGLPTSTGIEFIVKLPDLEPPGGSWVHCRGHVVRHCGPTAEGTCALAATIDAYDFLGVAPDGLPVGVES